MKLLVEHVNITARRTIEVESAFGGPRLEVRSQQGFEVRIICVALEDRQGELLLLTNTATMDRLGAAIQQVVETF